VQHRNHTWQAWRDRYLKTLDNRSEEWKQAFTDQAQAILDGLNGEDNTMTTSTRTKRARSDESRDQHITLSTKKQRMHDPNRDKAARCPSPSKQLISEQEEAVQRPSFRALGASLSPPSGRSSSPEVIDLKNREGSVSASSYELDMDDLTIPEPEGGFATETQFQTQTGNQTRTQSSSSPPASSRNLDKQLPSIEESKPRPDQELVPDLADYDQNNDDENDKDEEAVPDFHTLYASFKSRGYSDAHIATALYATSANPDVLELVFEELEAGRGVPQDVKNVWTENDDKLLMIFEDYWGENIAKKSSIARKHGLTGCEWRRAFLKTMRLGNGALGGSTSH